MFLLIVKQLEADSLVYPGSNDKSILGLKLSPQVRVAQNKGMWPAVHR